MAFGITGDDLPRLRNYVRAKEHYDSTTPIRGKTLRPLGKRTKQHQQIRPTMRNGAGAAGLACVLYHTECVTYYEDGTIHLNHGGYIRHSTCTFIERIAPVSGVRMDKQRDCLVVRLNGGEYKIGNDGLWLKRDETGTFIPVDPKPFEVATVNRAAMRRVKKQYAAFMTYAVGLGKLTQWSKPEVDGHHWVGDAEDLLNAMRGEDMEQWAWAYPRFVLQAGRNSQRYDYSLQGWVTDWVYSKKHCDALLTHMVKQAHGAEVLVREALPLGEHRKDPNHKYVRYPQGGVR